MIISRKNRKARSTVLGSVVVLLVLGLTGSCKKSNENPAVVINSFTANPNQILKGKSATLSWTTTNAESVSINNGVGTVALNGSTEVSPSATITYVLTATGKGGSTTSNAVVTVNEPPPYYGEWRGDDISFDVNEEGKVVDLEHSFTYIVFGCGAMGAGMQSYNIKGPLDIIGNTFSYTDSEGTVTGTFTSDNTVEGSWTITNKTIRFMYLDFGTQKWCDVPFSAAGVWNSVKQ